jgi:DNA-binding NtrC family response regulator
MAYIFSQRISSRVLPSSGVPRVAIVDNDPELLSLYARHLADMGLEPVPFFDVEEAVGFVFEQKPEAIMLDASLISEKRLPLLKELRDEHPSLILVTIGAHASEYDIDQLMMLGASCHINKQFSSPKDVSVTLVELLG